MYVFKEKRNKKKIYIYIKIKKKIIYKIKIIYKSI